MATRGNAGQLRRLKIIVLADLRKPVRQGCIPAGPGFQSISVEIKFHGAIETILVLLKTCGKAKADPQVPPALLRCGW